MHFSKIFRNSFAKHDLIGLVIIEKRLYLSIWSFIVSFLEYINIVKYVFNGFGGYRYINGYLVVFRIPSCWAIIKRSLDSIGFWS